MPKLSVIVPIYNVELYLARGLNCLKNQTLKEIEFLLIDDGSTDNSLQICEKFALEDNRFKVFTQKNSGVSAARNLGIINAESKYIAFMDPDDDIEDNMYEVLYNRLKDFGTDVCFCNYSNIENKKVYPCKLPYKSGVHERNIVEDIIANIVWSKEPEGKPIMGSIWRGIYRKDLILENNIFFPLDIRPMQDLLFIIHYLSVCNNIYIEEKILYYYHTNPNSGVTGFKNNMWSNNINVINLLEDALKKVNLLAINNNRISYRWFSMINWCVINEAHPNNPLNYKQKINNIKGYISHEKNYNYLNQLNNQNLSLQKSIILYCIKKRYAFTLYILAKIKIIKSVN